MLLLQLGLFLCKKKIKKNERITLLHFCNRANLLRERSLLRFCVTALTNEDLLLPSGMRRSKSRLKLCITPNPAVFVSPLSLPLSVFACKVELPASSRGTEDGSVGSRYELCETQDKHIWPTSFPLSKRRLFCIKCAQSGLPVEIWLYTACQRNLCTLPMSNTIDYQSENVLREIPSQREELRGKM